MPPHAAAQPCSTELCVWTNLSLFYAVWRSHSPDIPKESRETKALAQMGYEYYHYLMKVSSEFPSSQFHRIRYEDLVNDLQGVVENIYSQFNLTLDQEFRFRLSKLDAQGKNYQSVHEYSLEEYGLDKEVIYSELADVFKAYGFSREGV